HGEPWIDIRCSVEGRGRALSARPLVSYSVRSRILRLVPPPGSTSPGNREVGGLGGFCRAVLAELRRRRRPCSRRRRGGQPRPAEGRPSSQPPQGSRAVYASWTTSFLLCPYGATRRAPRANIQGRKVGRGVGAGRGGRRLAGSARSGQVFRGLQRGHVEGPDGQPHRWKPPVGQSPGGCGPQAIGRRGGSVAVGLAQQ